MSFFFLSIFNNQKMYIQKNPDIHFLLKFFFPFPVKSHSNEKKKKTSNHRNFNLYMKTKPLQLKFKKISTL